MLSGLPILILASAQAATAPPPDQPVNPGAVPCQNSSPSNDKDEVVICVERQEGYRLNPDLREAEREMKRKKLRRPERFADTSRCSVGPQGCVNSGVPILGIALTAVEIARRAATGGNVGEVFVTEPQTSEYEIYQALKRERDAKRAAADAAAAPKSKAYRDLEAEAAQGETAPADEAEPIG